MTQAEMLNSEPQDCVIYEILLLFYKLNEYYVHYYYSLIVDFNIEYLIFQQYFVEL